MRAIRDPWAKHGAAQGPVSWESHCETTFARRFDLRAYQRTFPDRCARYFRSTGLNAAEIAVAYGVDARTAQNWLDGIVAPRGDKVARIALIDPEGFSEHFGAAA